jgi:hypothetical protein
MGNFILLSLTNTQNTVGKGRELHYSSNSTTARSWSGAYLVTADGERTEAERPGKEYISSSLQDLGHAPDQAKGSTRHDPAAPRIPCNTCVRGNYTGGCFNPTTTKRVVSFAYYQVWTDAPHLILAGCNRHQLSRFALIHYMSL